MAGPRQQGQQGGDRDLAQVQLASPLLALPAASGHQGQVAGAGGFGPAARRPRAGAAWGPHGDRIEQPPANGEIEAPALQPDVGVPLNLKRKPRWLKPHVGGIAQVDLQAQPGGLAACGLVPQLPEGALAVGPQPGLGAPDAYLQYWRPFAQAGERIEAHRDPFRRQGGGVVWARAKPARAHLKTPGPQPPVGTQLQGVAHHPRQLVGQAPLHLAIEGPRQPIGPSKTADAQASDQGQPAKPVPPTCQSLPLAGQWGLGPC